MLCHAIVASGKKINNYANQILRKGTLSTIEENVELYGVTVAELGFKNSTEPETVFKRVLDVGYVLCTAEAIALARIQCNDSRQGIGAMEPIADSSGELHVLLLCRVGDGLWLRTDYVNPSCLLRPDCLLVVALPSRK
ncbi:MAG: hypothetical protein Q7T50_05560 [Candidatus Magasanikbacteria bacterium]|nr:hypothetical protein [Candidatus Magasanikbacteria bacterium]